MCACVYSRLQWSHMKFHAAIPTIRSTFHPKQTLVTKAEGMCGPPLCWECVTQRIARFGMKRKRSHVPECSAGRGSNRSHVVFFLASERLERVESWRNLAFYSLWISCIPQWWEKESQWTNKPHSQACKCPTQATKICWYALQNYLAAIDFAWRLISYVCVWNNVLQCCLYSSMSAVCVLYAYLMYVWRSRTFWPVCKDVIYCRFFYFLLLFIQQLVIFVGLNVHFSLLNKYG